MRRVPEEAKSPPMATKPLIVQLPSLLREMTEGDAYNRHGSYDGHYRYHLNWTAMQWIATLTAVFAVVKDRTDWRTDVVSALLVPYIAILLPDAVLDTVRGEPGRWLTLVGVLLRLFMPDQFPRDLELPLALLLLVIIVPSALMDAKDSPGAIFIVLFLGILLFYQHVQHSGSWTNAFTDSRHLTRTLAFVILLVIPILMLIAVL